MQSTYADSVLEEGGSNESTPATSSTGDGPKELDKLEQKEEGNGVIKVEGSDIKAAGKFLFSNIALFTAAFVAPSLIKHCMKAMSTKIYMASALLYLVNEIGLFTGFNKSINREMVAYLNRGDEDKQIESLETAAKQTRKAKEAAKRRAMIAKVAAAGFSAATAMALYEIYKETPAGGGSPGSTCTTGAIKLNNLGPLQKYSFEQKSSEFNNWLLAESNLINQPETIPSLVAVEMDQDSLQFEQKKEDMIELFKTALNQVILQNAQAAEKVGTDKDAKVVENKKTGEQKIVVNSVGSKLLAAGLGAAAGMVALQAGTLGKTAEAWVKMAGARAAGFGVFAGTAFGAAKESEDAANKLEERAQEYDRLANSLRNQVTQDVGVDTGKSQFIDQSVQTVDNDTGGIANNAVCLAGGTGLKLDASCSCSKTNSCAQPDLPDTSALPAFSGTPLLADSIKSLKATSGDMFAGRLKAATTNGQSLTNGAAKITRLRDAMEKKINADRLKAKADPVDFDRNEMKFKNGYANQLEKAFNNLSPREQAALSGISGGYFPQTDKDKEEKEEDLAKGDSAVDIGKKAIVDVNPNPGQNKDKTADGGTWDFNFEEDPKDAAAEQAAIDAALRAEEDQNYVVDGDINDDRNKNLFNIITRRYLKSAYPVIFEEK